MQAHARARPDRCKNFFALGLVYWMYERPLETTPEVDQGQVRQEPAVRGRQHAGRSKAGYNYGETVELMPVQYKVAKAKIAPGTYRKITGNEAAVLGLVAAAADGRQATRVRRLPDHPGQRGPRRLWPT